jgi:hypothetical protein
MEAAATESAGFEDDGRFTDAAVVFSARVIAVKRQAIQCKTQSIPLSYSLPCA